jgi:hypothetical protein
MAPKRRLILLAGTVAGLTIFGTLLGLRLQGFPGPRTPPPPTAGPHTSPWEGETYMAVFQADRRIGTTTTRLQRDGARYRLTESAHLRLNTMGLVQDLTLRSESRLNADLTLAEGTFSISSGLFRFSAHALVRDGHLRLTTRSADAETRQDLSLTEAVYTPGSMLAALAAARPEAGQRLRFPIFDPSSLARDAVDIQVEGPDTIFVGGRSVSGLRVTLLFKGARQTAWLDAAGRVLKEEGLLGIRQERLDAEAAGQPLPAAGSRDLVEVVAVIPDRELPPPEQIARLRVRLAGVDSASLALAGGRQALEAGVLSITRETPPAAADPGASLPAGLDVYLEAEAFIQSDHPAIRARAQALQSPGATPEQTLSAIVSWMRAHVQRRPVIAVPDALATLKAGMGDCNEHAVLLAALARAAGLPATIEAGLVYQRGRFFYHAWNRVFIGRWITADAVLGQIPADVSHIRLVEGGPSGQLDLLGLMGRLSVSIVDFQADPGSATPPNASPGGPPPGVPSPGAPVRHAAD